MKFKDLEKRYFDTVFYFLMPTRSIIILCRIGTAGARVTTQDAIAVQARARRAFICAAGGRRHTANPIKRAIADTASVRPSPSGSAPTTAAPAWGQVAAGWFFLRMDEPETGGHQQDRAQHGDHSEPQQPAAKPEAERPRVLFEPSAAESSRCRPHGKQPRLPAARIATSPVARLFPSLSRRHSASRSPGAGLRRKLNDRLVVTASATGPICARSRHKAPGRPTPSGSARTPFLRDGHGSRWRAGAASPRADQRFRPYRHGQRRGSAEIRGQERPRPLPASGWEPLASSHPAWQTRDRSTLQHGPLVPTRGVCAQGA